MTEAHKNGVLYTDDTLSNIITLYTSAGVKNVNEAVTVLFHSFLLEFEFIPKVCLLFYF